MVACPFQVPSFEYGKAINPEIKKCDFCYERTIAGKLPACVDICPVEALTYGSRTDLIKIARERIRRNPEKYVNYIYGEYEVGGTSWLYIANEEYKKLAFPKLGDKPAPGVSESIQHGIFAYFVPPASLYALLGGLMWITKRKESGEAE
jgi:ferredoxin